MYVSAILLSALLLCSMFPNISIGCTFVFASPMYFSVFQFAGFLCARRAWQNLMLFFSFAFRFHAEDDKSTSSATECYGWAMYVFFCVRLRTNLFLRVVLVERNNIQTSTGGQCPRWLRCSQNFGFRNVWFVDTSGHLRRNLFPNIRRLQVAWNMLQKNKHILLNKHIFNGIAAEEVVRCGGVSWRACNLFVGTDAYNYKNQVSFKDACFVPVSHGCNLGDDYSRRDTLESLEHTIKYWRQQRFCLPWRLRAQTPSKSLWFANRIASLDAWPVAAASLWSQFCRQRIQGPFHRRRNPGYVKKGSNARPLRMFKMTGAQDLQDSISSP